MTDPSRARATDEVADGIRRVTFPLPLGIDHVHCYLLRGDDGWTVVDTGLGVPDAEERWRAVLDELDAPVERIVVTHFHPDHVGGATVVSGLTGAPVLQGRLDHEQCVRAWGPERSPERVLAYLARHGMPDGDLDGLRREATWLARMVRYAPDPEPLEPGDRIDGWEVLHLPGHADGHLCLHRDGVLVAGDALLAGITPNVGLYLDGRPDPLGDYLDSLARVEALAPRLALPGHRETIDDPAARARDLIEHHRERLDLTERALRAGPRTAYEVSLELFPDELAPTLRRFALAEARAHLERLVHEGRAEVRDEGDVTVYARA